jgi:hypothetical protein
MPTHEVDLVSLDELRHVLKAHAGPDGPRERTARSGLRRTRPGLVAAVVAVAAVAATMAATPAWGLVRNVLPFWNQPHASKSDQLAFAELNIGAPNGMSPDVVSGDTRQVAQETFGGQTRTLWVAPAKDGGFCYLWSPGGGGCNTGPHQMPLGWSGLGVPQNLQGSPNPGLEWLSGYVLSPSVSDVAIRFSDGSSIHPTITWVSAPINAGFFAYDVPQDQQSTTDHVTEIDAYDANGNLVKSEPVGLTP